MRFHLNALSVALLLRMRDAVCSPVLPHPFEKRAACNEDNLLRALQATARTKDSYAFCSSYISIPATTTTTVFTGTSIDTYTVTPTVTVHPVEYRNLPRANTASLPITYNSISPSPSTISNPYTYGNGYYPRKRAPLSPPPALEARATTSSLPSYVATYPPARISSACSCLGVPAANTYTVSTYFYTQAIVTASCTVFSALPDATYPAFCVPSGLANAATASSHPAVQTLAPSPVASKSDCCLRCAETLNCVWYLFTFATPGQPWAGGTCAIAYHTDVVPVDGNTPTICPNGMIGSLLGGVQMHGETDFTGLSYPGYNWGPCGGALGSFQSSEDNGEPVGGEC